MKGITCCGDCVFYDWKKHRCKRGFNAENDPKNHFFDDCPLPDVRPARWIPVTERLPEKGKYLAVLTPYDKQSTPYIRMLEYFKNIRFEGKYSSGWYDYDGELGYYKVVNVTHWMPLPEPPKEDGTDDV